MSRIGAFRAEPQLALAGTLALLGDQIQSVINVTEHEQRVVSQIALDRNLQDCGDDRQQCQADHRGGNDKCQSRARSNPEPSHDNDRSEHDGERERDQPAREDEDGRNHRGEAQPLAVPITTDWYQKLLKIGTVT